MSKLVSKLVSSVVQLDAFFVFVFLVLFLVQLTYRQGAKTHFEFYMLLKSMHGI